METNPKVRWPFQTEVAMNRLPPSMSARAKPRACKVSEHGRRTQGEEPAKVSETSLAFGFRAVGEMIRKQGFSIGYNFPHAKFFPRALRSP
jgi:hypothetical protein